MWRWPARASAIEPGSDRALTFGGRPSVTVPPGAPILSDPVDLAVPALGSVAVSLFLPEITPTTTWHNEGAQTAYISGRGQPRRRGRRSSRRRRSSRASS